MCAHGRAHVAVALPAPPQTAGVGMPSAVHAHCSRRRSETSMDAAHNWQAWWVMVDLGFNARKSKLLLAKDCGERGYRKNLLVVPFLRVALTATGLVSDGRLSNVLGLSNSHKVYTLSLIHI